MGDITSAVPERLTAFAEDGGRARLQIAIALQAVRDREVLVQANSEYREMGSEATSATAQWVIAGGDLEARVVTIRDALIAADAAGAGPNVPTDALVEQLTGAGLAAPVAVIDAPPASMMGLPPYSGFVDDPVCAANGNFVHVETDLAHPGVAVDLDIVRVYNSLAADRDGAFGPGWTSLVDVHLVTDSVGVRLLLNDGGVLWFQRHGDEWRPVTRRNMTLTRVEDGWVARGGAAANAFTWLLDAEGRLTTVVRERSRASFSRNDTGQVVRIDEATSGRFVELHWSDGHVVKVTSSDGRAATYRHARSGHLVEALPPHGSVRYEHTDGIVSGSLTSRTPTTSTGASSRNSADTAARRSTSTPDARRSRPTRRREFATDSSTTEQATSPPSSTAKVACSASPMTTVDSRPRSRIASATSPASVTTSSLVSSPASTRMG
jgi:hypothetical protein